MMNKRYIKHLLQSEIYSNLLLPFRFVIVQYTMNTDKEIPLTDITGNPSSYEWTPEQQSRTASSNKTCTCVECLDFCMQCMNCCELIVCCLRCFR